MKRNLNPTKLTGWKMLVVVAMLMLAAVNADAQHRHHGPPPPPANFDSIVIAHIDSFLAHHPGDTLPLPPFHHHHDSIPLPPTPVPFPDSGWWRHFGHDTFPFPPIPVDTGHNGGGHHDTIPAPPFPPDTTSTGGGHHDTIPCPPLPPDTGWTGGGNPGTPPLPWDTAGGPHHKDLLVINNNSPAGVSIFPNPVVNTSTMRIENASSTVTFRLYDMNGRAVREMTNLSNGDLNFEKGNLTPGVYVYEMIDGNTKASAGRVLIQ